MKKSMILPAAIAIAFAVSSCELQVNVEQSRSYKVHFTTASPEVSKTVIGTRDGDSFPVLWNGGEDVEISLNENTKTRDLPVTVSVATSPSAEATWSYDFGEAIEKGSLTAPFTFFAFYPGSNVRAFYYDSEKKIKIEDMPSEQTPGATSCDPKAMFVYSISESFTEFPNEVTMPAFEHMGAYACITLGTGIPADAVVESVTVTANDGTHLCGPAWFWYADEESNAKGDWTDHSSTSNANCAIKINTSSKSNIWMGCRPTTDLTSLTFEVNTDKGIYTKTVSTTKQLQAGKVATMTINGFAPAGTPVSYLWSVAKNNVITGQGTASGTSDKESLTGPLSWNGNVTTQTVSTTDPDLTWTFTATATGGRYYVAKGSVRNQFGTSASLLSPIIVDAPIDNNHIIKKISIWSSVVGGGKASDLTIKVKVGDTYVIGSSSAGAQGAVSVEAVKNTGFETTSGDISSQGLKGAVQVIIEDNYPIYLYKIQVDCIAPAE